MIFEDLIRKKWLRKFGCSVGVLTLSRIRQNLTQIYSVCWFDFQLWTVKSCYLGKHSWRLLPEIYLAHYLTLTPVSTNGASRVYFFWSKSNKMPRCGALGKEVNSGWALPIYCYSSQSKECKWCSRNSGIMDLSPPNTNNSIICIMFINFFGGTSLLLKKGRDMSKKVKFSFST